MLLISLEDLPMQLRSELGEEASQIYFETFNNFYKENEDLDESERHDRAHQLAIMAAKWPLNSI